MARPVFAHELQDPDFTWLLGTLREKRGDLLLLDTIGSAVVLIPVQHNPVQLLEARGSEQQLLPQSVSGTTKALEPLRKR